MPTSAPARTRALAFIFTAAALIASGCSGDGGTPTQPGTGALAVTVNGLPSGASASVTVTGPGGYSSNIAHSSTLANLAPGSYQLTASTVASHDTNYVPSPATATLTVAADADASATVVYSRTLSTLDLTIAAMYLTQSTQTLSGAVPLVQNRDGYLRVFVVANQGNNAAPQVRVRFYVNGTQQGSPFMIAAPSHSVPSSLNQGVLASSWNVAVPGSMIKPGLSILADVDPSHAVPESQRGNNSFPVSGTPQPLTVKNLSTFYHQLRPRDAERERPHGQRLEFEQGRAAREDGEDPSDLRVHGRRARHVHDECAAALRRQQQRRVGNDPRRNADAARRGRQSAQLLRHREDGVHERHRRHLVHRRRRERRLRRRAAKSRSSRTSSDTRGAARTRRAASTATRIRTIRIRAATLACTDSMWRPRRSIRRRPPR